MIPYVNFPAQFAEEKAELMAVVEAVFARGDFVGGEAIAHFEDEVAAYCGVPHAVALNSGTDALIIAMKALGIGPGDEMITPPNSFVASTAAIIAAGAIPVFADVQNDLTIDPAAVAAVITPRTRAIMPVHLTGHMADMTRLMELAERHGLAVIEDAAQSIGSRRDGRLAGTIGRAGCFSAHPLKNLNAAGDAGYLITGDSRIAEKARLWRNHGLVDRNTVVEWGTVSRMDTLQAEILRLRLRNLPRVIERRRANAALYRQGLASIAQVTNAPCRDGEFNTFHLFVIEAERRDDLQKYLADRGIGTGIHYPIPIHLQPAAKGLGYGPGAFPVAEAQAGRMLSLPINQFVSGQDIDHICATIAAFYAEGGH